MDDIEQRIYNYLIKHTDLLKYKDQLTEEKLRQFLARAIQTFCEENEVKFTDIQKLALVNKIVESMISYGPLRPLMEDPAITEIMVNGPSKIYIQRNGKIELSNVKFTDGQHLMHTVYKVLAISGSTRRVDESLPYVDFSLPDGSRANVIIPPVSLVGAVMTIRKFSDDIGTVDDLLKRGMLEPRMATLLTSAIKAKLNIVFCGATGTGKTTALNVLSRHISTEERIITIEDTAELRLMQEHVVSLQTKAANVEGRGVVSIRDLFVNSLRMRPDRIIIGEIRGEEALDLIQSISSGHSGSLAIVHADSPEDCFNRLVTMLMMTGIRLSTEELKKQIANAIDLIVHAELYIDGVRRLTNITDVQYIEGQGNDGVVLRDIFRYEAEKVVDGKVIGQWVMDKRPPSFLKKYRKRNVTLPAGFFNEESHSAK